MQMITSVFETILLLSLLGTVAALAVTLLSAAVKRKINSSWLCSIHLLVLLFFLVPFWLVFDLPVKAIDVSGQLNGVIPAEIEPIDSVERNEKDQFDMDKRNEVIPTGNDLGASPSERSGNEVPIHDSPAAKTGFKEILVFCWIAGGLIVSMKHFIGYRKFKVQIEKSNIEVRDRKTLDLLERYKKEMNIKKIALSINPCVQSPILFGFQRACIIIPNLSFSYGDLVMILKHECIHYKRKDNYIKLLGLGVKCVHWFNPAVYCHFSKINQLCEMACDEKLIKTLDYEGRKQYVLMIIHALEMIKKERQGIFAAFGSNLKTVERRVKNIMCEKKPDSKGYISFITVTALICFFTIGVAYAISPDKEMTKAEAESLKNLTTVDNQGEQVENQAIADLVAEEMQKYGVSVENAETVIDSKIQTILSNELAVLPDNTSYSGIITDLATGEILAAAGNVTDKIYPGMALRGVIGAIVEDSGITDSMAKASDDPLIYTDGADTDSIRYWNANERKGFQSLQQTIVNSCEPALARFFSELEPDGALEYLKGFGLIPEDTSSLSQSRAAMIAVGRDQPVSVKEVSQMYSAILGDGKMKEVHFLKDGDQKSETKQVISQETAQRVRQWLVQSSKEGFSTSRNKHPGIYGGYGSLILGQESDSKYNCVFISFAPADNPQCCIVIGADSNMGEDLVSGRELAPIAEKIADQL